jgi:uncharacterized protein YndB with AHSA1/START domain
MVRHRNSSVALGREVTPGHVERSVTLAASLAEVWASLIDADQLASWFGADVEIEARVGGRATFRWAGGLERSAVLEQVVPERILSFRWLPFVKAEGEVRSLPLGRVELTLEQTTKGTRLTVAEWSSVPESVFLVGPAGE